VKTTLSVGGFPATISSLEQLDDSVRQPLFLAAIRLHLDAEGATLPGMADVIREMLSSDPAALELFDVRLMQAGLLRTMAQRYSRCFSHLSTVMLPVRDDFPRLTRANVDPAIRRARYEIDLALVSVQGVDLPNALEALGAV
jgi:hypothetical protein